MAAETGFQIDGTIYEAPGIDSLSMEEWQWMYDYAGLGLTDFVPAEGQTEQQHEHELDSKLKNPGFTRALAHIAYQRGNPDVPAKQVRDLIAQANFLAALSTLAAEPEPEDEAPLASTSAPPASSETGSLENASTNEQGTPTPATGSSTSLVRPDSGPQATGVLKSVTSPISGQEISAA